MFIQMTDIFIMLSSLALGKEYSVIRSIVSRCKIATFFEKDQICFISEMVSRVSMSVLGDFKRSNHKIFIDILILRKPLKYSRRI